MRLNTADDMSGFFKSVNIIQIGKMSQLKDSSHRELIKLNHHSLFFCDGATSVQPTRKRHKTHLQFQLRAILIYFCPGERTTDPASARRDAKHSLQSLPLHLNIMKTDNLINTSTNRYLH